MDRRDRSWVGRARAQSIARFAWAVPSITGSIKWESVSLLPVLLLVQACSIYRALPLDKAAVESRLAPPDLGVVRVQAK